MGEFINREVSTVKQYLVHFAQDCCTFVLITLFVFLFINKFIMSAPFQNNLTGRFVGNVCSLIYVIFVQVVQFWKDAPITTHIRTNGIIMRWTGIQARNSKVSVGIYWVETDDILGHEIDRLEYECEDM